ncbi:hypothetical protein NBRC116583_26200 [Arenicella sp. 4NH20-0111]|uniref:S8 family serine peptidase n=1 Tax=Arenicella sp. 4NH20-0111 TaxID=3127648 RepID=UPI00310A6B5E
MKRRFPTLRSTKVCLSALSLSTALLAGTAAAQNESYFSTPANSGNLANFAAKASDLKNISTDIYIVEFEEKPAMEYEGNLQGMAATKPLEGQKLAINSSSVSTYKSFLSSQHDSALRNCGIEGHQKIYSYNVAFNGMAARMTAEQAALMRTEKNVKSVRKDTMLQMQTDSTREFMKLTKRRDGAWRNGITGEDVIIAVLDSGIHPENPSFADVPTPKRGDRGRKIAYGQAPERWVGDECDFGNTAFNPEDVPFTCNNKLLGARAYSAGFLNGADPAVRLASGSSLSARDDNGHGSAAASNAAGNYGVQAVIGGENVGEDVMSGVAPRARIAAYKVCWDGPLVDDPATPANEDNDDGCANSDSMAAIDQAVADGVDVINFSVGGASVSFGAPDARAFLNAAGAGVFVASSAGNSGPDRGTVGAPAVAPWITSVGAVNDDQNFALAIDVTAPASVAGQKTAIEGAGPVQLEDIATIAGNVVVAEPANGCDVLTNPGDVAGNIALVIRGGCGFNDKYLQAEAAGAVAIVVYNDGTAPDRLNPFVMGGLDAARTIPGVMIGFTDGDSLAGSAGVAVTIDAANEVSLANRVVDFSSRGPNRGALDIIKPDVVAPGVNILSAETPFENADAGSGGESQQFISGTSFSGPHVAGALALIKQAHPDWSPAMARSALMTSARQNVMTQFDDAQATPFDMGAGHIVPNNSFDPGLVYDITLDEYNAFSCENNAQQVSDETCDELASQGFSFKATELNLPSIGVGTLVGQETITRTVTSAEMRNPYRYYQKRAFYKAVIDAPEGVNVTVSPRYLALRPGQSKDYSVTFDVQDGTKFDEFTFGSITWVELGKRRKGQRKKRNKYHYVVKHNQNYGYNSYGYDYDDYDYGYGYGRNHGWGHGSYFYFFDDLFSYLFDYAREAYSPIAVRPVALSVPDSVNASSDSIQPGTGEASVPVTFGYTGDYTAGLLGLAPSIAFPNSITAADGLKFDCFDLPAFDHLRVATYDDETSAPGIDDIDLRVFTTDDCASFANLQQVAASANGGSTESIDLANPTAGGYIFVVDYRDAAASDTVNYVVNITPIVGDSGNAVLAAPASAVRGETQNAIISYAGLAPARYTGVVTHSDANGEIARTTIDVEVPVAATP